ncbi:DUF4209 domain-containing protein [Roseateles sp.]|uniref:DUF4209 domain-containing protein n=1 Tax=Roseateles sp. TaxID=1971397 RepID=UPI003BA8F4F0
MAEAIDHHVLRARLSDIAWLGAKPRKIADALRAIDAYTASPPEGEDWVNSMQGWGRAISLCLQLRKGADDRLDKIEAVLAGIVATSIGGEGGLGLAAAQLLFDRHLSHDRSATLAELIAASGQAKHEAGNDFWRARSHFVLAGAWFQRRGDLERAADMTLSIAVSFEAEAEHRIALDAMQGHLVAASFYEDAIQALRKIPKAQRPNRDIEAHLKRLLHLVTESGEKAVNALPLIESGRTDITEFVRGSEEAVTGKPLLEALLVLTHLHSGASAASMRKNAEKTLREFPITTMFGSTHMSLDGRTIAKTQGGSLDGAEDENEDKLWEIMMRHYGMDIELVCKAQILPALHVIVREHWVRKADLAHLMSMSPVVPPDRSEQFAKGLWEAFEYDFATATYLLAPQIEHLVRWHLKQASVKTTNLDKEGIENEVGLSTLVELPETKAIFGEDLAFELKALFCNALGPNLRNGVAHGLLDANHCHSPGAIYAWWWVLRLTIRSFWQARRAATQAPPPNPSEA